MSSDLCCSIFAFADARQYLTYAKNPSFLLHVEYQESFKEQGRSLEKHFILNFQCYFICSAYDLWYSASK